MEKKENQGERKPTIGEGKFKEPEKKSKYMRLRKQEYNNQATKFFKRLKGMKLIGYLIMCGKLKGQSDAEIAEELQCHESTISRHKKELQDSAFMDDIGLKVLDLANLGVEALRVNLIECNPFVTVKYMEGMGIWKKSHIIQHKSDPKTVQKKMAKQLEDTLGLKAQEQLNQSGVDTEKEAKKDG
jgi:hypothetical protein